MAHSQDAAPMKAVPAGQREYQQGPVLVPEVVGRAAVDTLMAGVA